jgi:predicted transposase YbfD/YdcC
LPLLRQIDLNDVVVTGDALFAQRGLCTYIVEQGGQYVFEVKDNQPALLRALQRSLRKDPGRGRCAND